MKLSKFRRKWDFLGVCTLRRFVHFLGTTQHESPYTRRASWWSNERRLGVCLNDYCIHSYSRGKAFTKRVQCNSIGAVSHLTQPLTLLPGIKLAHPQMHPLNRLRRQCSSNMNFLLRVLHLKCKPANHTRHRTPQLRTRKVLSNT